MQYMLIFNETPAEFESRANGASQDYWTAWQDYMAEMGPIVQRGNALEDPGAGSTLRLREGRVQIQDGPAPEAKELLGGYVVIEVEDLDTALKWAGKCPCAATGSVEIRPVLQMG